MKKQIPSFLAGALSMALVGSLAVSALAVSGQISYNSVDISVMGKQAISAGDTYTAESGVEIPSAITYVDENGGETTYVALRKMAELLDVPISWDDEARQVLFGENTSSEISIVITNGAGETGKEIIYNGPSDSQNTSQDTSNATSIAITHEDGTIEKEIIVGGK